MYLKKEDRYVPDSEGLILVVDIEAAAQKGWQRGEVYEIALVGVNHSWSMELYIRPGSYARTRFAINAEATEFLRNEHGVEYFDWLEDVGISWDIAARFLYEQILHLKDNFKEVVLWSQGNDYDFPLLEHFLGQAGLTVPWHYRNQRCLRTMRSQFPDLPYAKGTHRAITDAEAGAHNLRLLQGQQLPYYDSETNKDG